MLQYCQSLSRQFIDFNKKTIDNNFSSMSLFQEQAETMVNGFYEQINWLPEEGRRILDEWFKVLKQGLESYRSFVDEQYRKMLDVL